MKCKKCDYCKMRGRANAIYDGYKSYGRGEFWCEHPDTGKIEQNYFKFFSIAFIGFGTAEKDSKLQMKISPQWCPLRKGKNNA